MLETFQVSTAIFFGVLRFYFPTARMNPTLEHVLRQDVGLVKRQYRYLRRQRSADPSGGLAHFLVKWPMALMQAPWRSEVGVLHKHVLALRHVNFDFFIDKACRISERLKVLRPND